MDCTADGSGGCEGQNEAISSKKKEILPRMMPSPNSKPASSPANEAAPTSNSPQPELSTLTPETRASTNRRNTTKILSINVSKPASSTDANEAAPTTNSPRLGPSALKPRKGVSSVRKMERKILWKDDSKPASTSDENEAAPTTNSPRSGPSALKPRKGVSSVKKILWKDDSRPASSSDENEAGPTINSPQPGPSVLKQGTRASSVTKKERKISWINDSSNSDANEAVLTTNSPQTKTKAFTYRNLKTKKSSISDAILPDANKAAPTVETSQPGPSKMKPKSKASLQEEKTSKILSRIDSQPASYAPTVVDAPLGPSPIKKRPTGRRFTNSKECTRCVRQHNLAARINEWIEIQEKLNLRVQRSACRRRRRRVAGMPRHQRCFFYYAARIWNWLMNKLCCRRRPQPAPHSPQQLLQLEIRTPQTTTTQPQPGGYLNTSL